MKLQTLIRLRLAPVFGEQSLQPSGAFIQAPGSFFQR